MLWEWVRFYAVLKPESHMSSEVSLYVSLLRSMIRVHSTAIWELPKMVNLPTQATSKRVFFPY